MLNTEERFHAPGLKAALKLQGRQLNWIAAQCGLSLSTLSRACIGERTIDRSAAEKIETLIGVPFDVLFKSPSGTDSLSHRELERVA